MPLVQVKVIKGVFDSDQKQDMISQLTETMVSIEGEALRGVTWVTIDEVESGDWGIGGNAITAQYVKDLQKTPAVTRSLDPSRCRVRYLLLARHRAVPSASPRLHSWASDSHRSDP